MTTAERLEHLGRLRPQLVRFARARLRNAAHAEDAVQEALVAAIERIETFSGASSLHSWLTGILKHKIVDCVRRSARDQFQPLDADGVPEGSDRAHVPAYGPEQVLECRQLWESLLRCLQDLPERTAEAFVLREFMGLNTTEASRALAVSESNCAVMLHRARVRVRARLAPQWCKP
ncbi:MAG: sigma-70 family RNA polymerase sigma factor [Burkholderiales bacterium]